MRFEKATEFTGSRAWDALDIAAIEGATVRLHWTDQPYHWHVNDGQEVFVVIEGTVHMHFDGEEGESMRVMGPGDICHCVEGDRHYAEPIGTARILVIEKAGSE